MLIRLDPVNNRADLAVRPDHKRRPVDSDIFPPVHALFFEHVELLGYRFVFIGQKRVWQVVFLFEFFLRGRLVPGNAEDNGACALDFLECVAEPARLQRSTRRIGFRVKKQDHVLAAIVLQGYRLAFFIGKRELWGFIINLHGFSVFINFK